MGLDMYLEGHKAHARYGNKPRPTCPDGFEIKSTTVDLGQWRKHPNLHGYIVNTYAEGEDECQKIYLDSEQLEDIADAIENNRLPHTEGFFFGKSECITPEEEAKNVEKFRKASEWLKGQYPISSPAMPLHKYRLDDWSYVIYQASW